MPLGGEMQAVVYEGSGPLLATLAVPTPQAAEVLVQIERAAICRTDVEVAAGRLAVPYQPMTLGHELAGVIVGYGAEVPSARMGERVAVFPWSGCEACASCVAEQPHLCASARQLGVHRHGAFADYIVVPARSAYVVGPTVSWVAAAYAEPVCAALAVMGAGLVPGQRGVIAGENRFAELTRRVLVAHGITDVEVVGDVGGLKRSSFDFAIETSPRPEVLSALLRALVPRGRLVLKSRATQPVALDLGELVKKEVVCHGAFYGSFREALALLERLAVDDLAGATYALGEFRAAFASAASDESHKIFFAPGR